MRHTGLAHLLRLLTPLFLLVVNPAVLGADSLRGPNIVLTSDAPGVRVEGAFERIRARQSRSAAVCRQWAAAYIACFSMPPRVYPATTGCCCGGHRSEVRPTSLSMV